MIERLGRIGPAVREIRASLVGEVLLMQLLWAISVYVLVVGGLWWFSSRVIEDNFRQQAIESVARLDEISIPFFIAPDNAGDLALKEHINIHPEIAYVRFYDALGESIFERKTDTFPEDGQIEKLSQPQIERLRATKVGQKPYLFELSVVGLPIRAAAPVWIRSIESDGMFDFEMNDESAENVEVIGFVEIGLDYTHYQTQLILNLLIGSLIIALFFIIAAVIGRRQLKRALMPLSDLRKSLTRLAQGDVDVQVDSTGHAEIVEISSALNTTIRALRERDEELHRLANHDALTSLANRNCFTGELAREIPRVVENNTSSALFFVDLDQFKYVNDTLGHAAGDRLLIQVAECLKSRLTEKDLIARFGGDEFTVLIRDTSRPGAIGVATMLIKLLQEYTFIEEGQSFNIYCSIGITMIDSDSYESAELLSQADIACNEAKARGRNCYHFYEISGQDKAQMAAEVDWSHRITEVLKHDEFILFYQPIVSVSEESDPNYEVLLRMPHKDAEPVSPNAFLPTAERFGLAVDIDRWVIRNTLHSLARHRASGDDITFFINLTGHIFEDPDLLTHIQNSLEDNGLPPSSVVFEITEQVAVRHMERANVLIRMLQEMGCRFALDDFGTGFSSFNYIKQLPVDFIKIEGSFVESMMKDATDQALVKSIIEIAKHIGKKTIAEHVPDAATMELLHKLGVDFVQGHYVGRPSETLSTEHFKSRKRKSSRIVKIRPT